MSRYVSIAEAKRTIAYTMLRSLGLTQFYTQSIIDSTLSPFLTRTNPFLALSMYHYYDNDLQSDLDACTVVSSLVCKQSIFPKQCTCVMLAC
uniref:Uncharacterized protein n=1 Tax=Agaricus bisporus TaxID=5341 RepID=A0A1Q1M964_AGABI|nr:hypothetical protein [Agaricus bisporus]